MVKNESWRFRLKDFKLSLVVAAAFVLPMAGLVFAQSSTCPMSNNSPRRPSSAQSSPAVASAPALPMTQAQGAAILEELRRIEILLASRLAPTERATPTADAPQQARIKIESGWYALGRENAQVAVIEFVDLQCPFCRRFHTTTFAKLKANYIDTGKLRFFSRDLPLPMHRYALDAAEAARCAGAQGKFWEFRDAVLSAGTPPMPDELTADAQKLGLDSGAFAHCQQIAEFRADIKSDEDDAIAAGIDATPSFVIGRVVNGWLEGTTLRGDRPYAAFQSAIDSLLSPSLPATQGKGRGK